MFAAASFKGDQEMIVLLLLMLAARSISFPTRPALQWPTVGGTPGSALGDLGRSATYCFPAPQSFENLDNSRWVPSPPALPGAWPMLQITISVVS